MVKKEVEVNFKMDKQDLLVTRQIETSISMDKGVSLKKNLWCCITWGMETNVKFNQLS